MAATTKALLLARINDLLDNFRYTRPTDKPEDFNEKDGIMMGMPMFMEDEYQDILYQMHTLHDLVELLKKLRQAGGLQ